MKRFLPIPGSLISLVIINLFLFSATKSFAAVKTWNGGTGGGKSWNVAGNWSPSGIPGTGDDIVFSTVGTITFSTMPTAIFSYGSLTISSGGSVVTFVAGSGCTLIIGSVAADPDFFVGGGGSSLTLGANVNITLATDANANISGDFFINPGRSFNTNGTNVATSVFGTINNQGAVNGTFSTLAFGSGCAYVHNQNGGVLPTANWDANSFCIITGLTVTHPSGGNQTFGNLTYNCTGMTTNLTMANGVSVARDFTVLSTGSARLLMTAGSFTVGRDLDIEADFTISNTTDRTLTVVRDAFISGGGNIDLCSGGGANIGTLTVGGNFTSFGALTETGTGKGVINFNGSAIQTFNQSGAMVNNIDIGINNSGGSTGVTFSSSTNIEGSLSLTNGILTIPSGITLTILNGNVIGGAGFGSGKHINTQVAGANQGFLQIDNMAASSYTIPLGNGTHYLPIVLTPANASSFTVSTFTGITENGLPNGTAFTPAKKQRVVDAVWTINRNSGSGGVNMTLAWPAALEGSLFSGYGPTEMGIAHWDNPNWGNCSGTGNNTANTVTRPGVTVFSPFAVGKTPFVLPIRFSYLNAAKGNGYNLLNWKAACNSSEVTFNIERSTDAVNYSTIHSITASQAQCAQPFNYIDNINLSGTVFYRIKSVEVTGQVTYSTIVKLTDQQKDMRLTAVVPNPVISQAQLTISTTKKDVIDLVIVTMDGKVLQRNRVQLQAGSSVISLDVAGLQKGNYMIKGTFGNGESNSLMFTKQ